MPAKVLDSFTRANSTNALGSTEVGALAWSQDAGTWGISSNQMYASNGNAATNCRATVDCGSADGIVSLTLAAGGHPSGLVFRSASSGNEYLLVMQVGVSAAVTLYKGVAGTYSVLVTGPTYTPAAGSVITVELHGDSIIIKDDGVVIIATTDSTYSSATRHGAYIGIGTGVTSAVRLDNFSFKPAITQARSVRTATPATVDTNWTAFVSDGTWDVVVDAAAGDVIELGALALWTSAGSFTYADFATIVSGSVVNWTSTGTGSHTSGEFAFFNSSSINDQLTLAGTTFYTVQAGDVSGGQVRFRLYGKVGASTRTLLASATQTAIVWAVKCNSTVSKATCTGTIGTSRSLMTGSVTVPAAVGTVLCFVPAVVVNPNAGAVGYFDAATVVSGSPVNYFSTGSSSPAAEGYPAWRCDYNDYEPLRGSALYVVQAGDISGGNVTVRLSGLTAASTRALDPGSAISLRAVA